MLTTPVLCPSTQLGLHIYARQLMTRFRRAIEQLHARTARHSHYPPLLCCRIGLRALYGTAIAQDRSYSVCVRVCYVGVLFNARVNFTIDTFSKCTHCALYTHMMVLHFRHFGQPKWNLFLLYISTVLWGDMLMTHWWWVSSHIRPIGLAYMFKHSSFVMWSHGDVRKIYSKLSMWILEIYDIAEWWCHLHIANTHTHTHIANITQLLHIESAANDCLYGPNTFNRTISTYRNVMNIALWSIGRSTYVCG